MALTITSDAATISTTEYSLNADSTTLAADTNDYAVQAYIDFANMAAGDQYEIRVLEKINAGSQLPIYTATVTGVQTEPFVTPSLILGEGWDVTVKKLAGTDRSIAWSIRTAG